ncbi:MAG: ATP-grasp domain-containing protein [Candidatus Thiodiazotropha sp. (ex Ustalcina ferruginea)]|nr:ATP-grasp domain-containing protein [Candidatus Thiodiazotropha sp. (ex Ustalcina ferruginea)]
MRIFVFEYITGGGMLDSTLPLSLVQEGDMMLRALISDLAEIDDIDIVATRDERLEIPDLPIEFCMLQNLSDFPSAWEACIESADAVWPIAPEYFQILKQISEAVLEKGKILLNSPPQAVDTASSKRVTSNLLKESGVQVVPTYRLEAEMPDRKGSWVLKPDDGVGCQGTKICRDRDELHRQLEAVPDGREYVIQPFVHGMPTSLNILTCQGEAFVLSVNRQRIAMTDNSFVLLGCVVNGYMEQQARFHNLGRDVAAAMPDLWGIVGIDTLDTDTGLKVLEVNPRITTSYVGLKESIGVNPAGLVLDLLNSKMPLSEQFIKAVVVDVNLEYAGAA